MHRLTLRPARRVGGSGPGWTKRPVAYLDWTVDDVSLRELLNPAFDTVFDLVGWLDDAWPDGAAGALRRLLGEQPADLPSGRCSLYVCPECADLGCGALTAAVAVHERTVTWSDLGREVDYEDGVERSQLAPVGPLVFDRAEYERTLRAELERLGAAGG